MSRQIFIRFVSICDLFCVSVCFFFFFFFQAEDGIRDLTVTGVQTCALPISADLAMALGHDPRTRELPIGVYPRLGVVRLSGAVHNNQQKAAAEEIARNLDRKSVV